MDLEYNGAAFEARGGNKMKTTNGTRTRRTTKETDALIAAHIEPHPAKPGIQEYRLRVEDNGYPVWAIIGALAPDASNADDVAKWYEISHEAIEAAWAYYRRNKRAIDDRLAANRAY
jgi:uncharacterized protein (DUF433 family)